MTLKSPCLEVGVCVLWPLPCCDLYSWNLPAPLKPNLSPSLPLFKQRRSFLMNCKMHVIGLGVGGVSMHLIQIKIY